MVLVTGGTGFLGSHLIFHLLQKGIQVRAMRRSESNYNLITRVFDFYGEDFGRHVSQIKWVEADLLDIYSLDQCLNGVEEVYHTAAKISFVPVDRKDMMNINVNGTANLVNLSIEHGIRKFCHVSSIAAIGRAETSGVINEEVVWKASKKNSYYAISKYGAEREVWRGIEEGLNAVILNPSIILGPGEISSGSARLIQTVEQGFPFYTRGINGFVDVRDVVKVMINLMESPVSGERYIVSAENMDYKTLFETIATEMGLRAPAWLARPWMSEIAWRIIALQSKITGHKPLISRETSQTALNRYQYSSEKLKRDLQFSFIPITQTIHDVCHFYKMSLQSKGSNKNSFQLK